MAKQTKKQKGSASTDQYNGDKNIQLRNIGDICKEHMEIFGANNNIMRHVPEVADGLKPGERRLLYAMYMLNSKPTGKKIKVARIIGDAIGKYHPHGDASMYGTLVKLAQPWSSIIPLVDGQGNYGDIWGAPAAAMRYIEARLTKYAWKCFFEDFSLDYVTTKMNYLGDEREPEFLPSRYPHALISSTLGIGYGLSTGMPSYNLREVLELTIKLLKNPDYKKAHLVPDTPTGALIVDEGQFETISETGRGKFKMRARIEIDHENNALHILTVPSSVKVNQVKSVILALQKEGKIAGVEDFIEGEDSPDGTRINFTIKLKKEIDPVALMYDLYTKTDLEKTFTVNFKLVNDYQDYDFNIRSLLLEWILGRREMKRTFFNHKLTSALERQHVLDTILMILGGKNGEKALKRMKESKSRTESISYLMDMFKITSLQAKMIVDLRLYSFNEDSVQRYREEKVKVDELVNKYDALIRNPDEIDKIIRAELMEGIELFGKPRQSEVITIDGERKIRDTDHVVVFTTGGMVKKLPIDSTTIGATREGDYPNEIIQVSNLTDLMIFDETGKISKVPVNSLTNSELDSVGEPLSKYATVQGKIAAVIPKPTEASLNKIKESIYFVMLTRNGIIKKTDAKNYVNLKNELLGMIVRDNDELISVKILVGDKDLLVYTSKGFGVRFPSSEIRETGRMTSGVKSIDLTEGEVVIGMDNVNANDKYLFAMTNRGTGKKSVLSSFKTMTRASKPLRIISLEDNEDVIMIKTVKGTEQFKAFLKNSVETINLDPDVKELPRLSKGRKIIGVRKGEVIIDVKENRGK